MLGEPGGDRDQIQIFNIYAVTDDLGITFRLRIFFELVYSNGFTSPEQE
jgi:hypothetical protein